MVSLLTLMRPTPFATKRIGGGCTRVSRPGSQAPGAPEGAPRTATIKGQNRCR